MVIVLGKALAREQAIVPAVEVAERPLELLRYHVRQEALWVHVRSHCRWMPTVNDKSFRYLEVGCKPATHFRW